MVDPLTGLALAGPLFQFMRFYRTITSLITIIQAADDLTKVEDLRINVFDTNRIVVTIWKLISGGVLTDDLTDEQQTVKLLSSQCQLTGLAIAEQLKTVSDSLNRQQRNPFAKQAAIRHPGYDTHIDFAAVEDYVHELIGLAEVIASIVTKSLTSISADYFKTLSLKDDVLQSGLSTILRLLEFGGANLQQDDFADNGPIQQCTDISTQSRLDQLNNIDTEPLTKPLQRTKFRRQTILDALYFRQMSDRIEEVNVAYKTTLEWIFRDKQYDLTWSSFPEFLKSESSDLPYWINGKAGSGKSTLLRFLVRHEQTMKHLCTWSGNKDLVVGHFFSWNLGTTLQKTQGGLLQSLLFQMLKRDPTMVHQVFPDLWHDIDPLHPGRPSQILFRDIRNALVKAIEISATQRCYCFFVDGIDEFDEDHLHVAELLLSLASSNLKFVLSSRPVDACLDRFQHCPKLRLQDLTAEDIQTYIDGRLSSHAAMLEVMQDEPKGAAELVHELKDRASGVFLWVKLVVNSLLDGLRKGDDITELKVRLRELPPDLGKLYASMLGKMNPNYSRQGATLFRLVRTASVLLDGQSMPTQFLAVAGRDFRSVVNGRPVAFETTKIVHWCKFLMRQLYSRCCGLVEVSSSIYTPDWWHADLDTLSGEDQILLSSHIQFLHRTVTEYLYQDHVWDAMVSKSSEESTFNPHENLAHAALHMMKISPLADNLSEMQAYRWAQTLIRAVREFEHEDERPLEDLTDEMDLVLSHHVSPGSHWSSHIEIEPAQKIAISHLSVLHSSIGNIFAFSAFVGLSEYVNAKIEKHGFVLDQATIQQTLLQTLFSRSSDWTNIALIHKFEVVSYLLEDGANPNETLRGPSFWQCCLQQVGALNCQNASFDKMTPQHRRIGRRARFGSNTVQDASQCRCNLQEAQIWAQILLGCLVAGARRGDIDYLASFSQSGQTQQICRFGQLCQTLYQVKSGNRSNPRPTRQSSTKQEPTTPMGHGQRYGATYGTNIISGPATAHLGDEYTYGDKITHVHHNYYGTGSIGASSPHTIPARATRQLRSANDTPMDDFAETLAWFKNEVAEVLKESSILTTTSETPNPNLADTEVTIQDRIMIRDKHWRGEVGTWSRRRCGNEYCQTDTTGGWDYVPSLKKLLCLDCYQSWRTTALRDKAARDRDLVFTMEEIFNDSFNTMSLVTTTNDSDDSDENDKDLPHDSETMHRMTFQHNIPNPDTEPDNVLTPRSVSISINRPASSINGDPYSLTSGSEHYLKSYRGRG